MRQFRRWSPPRLTALVWVVCALVIVAPLVAHRALCPDGLGHHSPLCISLGAATDASTLGLPPLEDWTDAGAVSICANARPAFLLSHGTSGRAPPRSV